MKSYIAITVFFLCVVIGMSNPGYTVKVDTQQTGQEFRIRTIKRGETPTIKADLFENGSPYSDLLGWGSSFVIFTNTSSTSVWSFAHASIFGNTVQYDLPSVGIPAGNYRAQFLFTNATRTVSFGHIGRVWVQDSPGTGGNITTNDISTPINFDLFDESGLISGVTVSNSIYLGDGSGLTGVASSDTRLDDTAATGTVDLAENILTNAVIDAADITVGTLPLSALSGITSNQIDAGTDSAYRTGDGTWDHIATGTVNLAENILTNAVIDAADITVGTLPLSALSGITSNQIDAGTDSAYRTGDGTWDHIATQNVDMDTFDIVDSGEINVLDGDHVTVGSPSNTFVAFQVHAQAGWSGAQHATTNHIPDSILTGDRYAGFLAAGEDSYLVLQSHNEGLHGSTIALTEVEADGTYVGSWSISRQATVSSQGGFFAIKQETDKDFFGFETVAPFRILTNNLVRIGGNYTTQYGLMVDGEAEADSMRVKPSSFGDEYQAPSQFDSVSSSSLILDGADTLLAICGTDAGTYGPQLSLVTTVGNTDSSFVRQWSFLAETTAGGKDLQLIYSEDETPGGETAVMQWTDQGNIITTGQIVFDPATITNLTEEASPTTGDFILAYEATAGAMRKLDVGNLPAGGKSIAVAGLSDTTTPSVLTTAETIGNIFSNYKSSGADHVFTMPVPHVSGNGIFVIGDEFQVDIEPSTGEIFYLNGTAMAANEHIQNTADTLGERIAFYAVNINGTLRWMFYSSDAAWVEETP